MVNRSLITLASSASKPQIMALTSNLKRAARDSNPNRQIRSLVLYVGLVGSRRNWPAQVGRLVDLDGSRRVPSDRLDDQPVDHEPSVRKLQLSQRGQVSLVEA
jgi:hypothetical protein